MRRSRRIGGRRDDNRALDETLRRSSLDILREQHQALPRRDDRGSHLVRSSVTLLRGLDIEEDQ